MIINNIHACEAWDIVQFGLDSGYKNAFTILDDLIYYGDPKYSITLSVEDYKFAPKAKDRKMYELLNKFFEHYNITGSLVICRDILER